MARQSSSPGKNDFCFICQQLDRFSKDSSLGAVAGDLIKDEYFA
jgi:hypothetical protein